MKGHSIHSKWDDLKQAILILGNTYCCHHHYKGPFFLVLQYISSKWKSCNTNLHSFSSLVVNKELSAVLDCAVLSLLKLKLWSSYALARQSTFTLTVTINTILQGIHSALIKSTISPRTGRNGAKRLLESQGKKLKSYFWRVIKNSVFLVCKAKVKIFFVSSLNTYNFSPSLRF